MITPVKSVLVVGGGLIGWWAAVFLKKTIPSLYVTILNTKVEDDCAQTIEQKFADYLSLIGITEQQIIKYADGNVHFSQAYLNWVDVGSSYFHTAEELNFDCDAIEFNQWLVKLGKSDSSVKIDDYSLSAAATKLGKSAVMLNNKANAVLSFDVDFFKKILVSYAVELSVNIIHKEIQKATLNCEGAINSIITADNCVFSSDFFIDASGYSGDLIGKAMGMGYESWLAYLPFQKKKVISVPPQDSRLIPFTAVQLIEQGWIKSVPLKNKIICEYIYNELLAVGKSRGKSIADFFSNGRDVDFYPGRRTKTWHKNCLAVGEAGVTVDNFSHSAFDLAASTLKKFVDFWPSSQKVDSLENEFNRIMRLEYESIRDFHCLHYAAIKINGVSSNPFWSNLSLPESAQYRLNIFMDCGRTVPDEATLFSSSQWSHLLLGLGCIPNNYDYIASHHNEDIYIQHAKNIKRRIAELLKKLPDHNSYIKAFYS